jgi:uncharacterized protein
MSAGLPETLDAWRMLAAQRSFTGVLPLSSMPRLCEALEQPDGECRFALEFDRGVLDVPYVEVRAQAELPLICQRTLKRFLLPVSIVQRLALVKRDGEEAELPEGYETVQPDADGTIRPVELIEDELILALPVVPMDPRSDPVEVTWPREVEKNEEEPRKNPFAVLANLKHKQ